jgi:nifR3 family TIM-barrel protein
MILKPILINNIKIGSPLTLAPMAGHTNRAFRTLCREMGDCGLVCTELISSHLVQGRSERSRKMFDWSDDEHPFAVQLFGSDPSIMAEAARIVEDAGADIIDINMGCWVPKVAKQGAGAALLRDVCTATRVVAEVVHTVSIPVTVKVRSGWDAEHLTAVEFARAAESVGVKAIAVHARTATQGFSGSPNWDIIRQVKEAVKDIPVIGNGDVTSAADVARMLAQTNCDGVMLGRAALGSPWVFRYIAHELHTGEALPTPTLPERAAIALRHAQLTMETTLFEERKAVLELRGQLIKYKLDRRGSVEVRNRLVQVETFADVESVLLPLVESELVSD